MAEAYSSDQPIRSRTEDLFHRSQFARRIAQTIAEQTDGSSLVVGIYGPWGDGKTSVLRMMEEELSSYSHVAVLRFNPWLFQSERELIQSFFDSIGEILNKKLATKAEEVGKWLKKYGSILAIAKISGVKDVGESLSTVRLEDIKERVDATLRESHTRLVVFIDDVDRLDEAEIHALFKLLKLSGSFENIAYVVACDDDVVASSLGKRYGAGNEAAGREFLEKIVQVPLHLPSADPFALRQIVANGIQDLMESAELDLTSDDRRTFWRTFVEGLQIRLKTPRQAKRYVNALRFAVPLLRGEVCLLDQLLVEGIRVFYPALYVQIREYRELFLADWPGAEGASTDTQFLGSALSGLSTSEKSAAMRVLKLLFPACRAFPDEALIANQYWLQCCIEMRRICTSGHFDRYFSYAVAPPEISDSQVSDLLRLAQWDMDLVVSRVFSMGGALRLLGKLRELIDFIEPSTALRVALALASNSELLSTDAPTGGQPSPLDEGVTLIKGLLARQPFQEASQHGNEVIRASRSVRFAVAFVSPVCHDFTQVRTAAEMIEAKADTLPPYHVAGVNLIRVLEVWRDGGGVGNTPGRWLQTRFATHPEEMLSFLRPFWQQANGNTAIPDAAQEQFYKSVEPFVFWEQIADLAMEYFGQARYKQASGSDRKVIQALMVIARQLGRSPQELRARPADQGE